MNYHDLKIRLGVSSCLLGNNVRYDGSHQRDSFIVDILGKFVEYVPVCPEVECGFGVPREPMRLEGDPENPRLITRNSKKDLTDIMVKWARAKVIELEKEELCGFIFKSKSPSSGMERVKVYGKDGSVSNKGVGIFARIFMEHFPYLPVEEDGRLNDLKIRENFIERIFVFARWKKFLKEDRTLKGLMEFHELHKLLIMSHNQKLLKEMGRLIASTSKKTFGKTLIEEYGRLLFRALKFYATPKKNSNVLYHCMGFLKRNLSSEEKHELIELIESYAKGYIPLIVPITLINHYVRKYDPPYLRNQYYLRPHPIELKLRNHA